MWGNNYYSLIYDVVKLQNKAIRVIKDVPIMENITPHYVNLGIFQFLDIVKLHTCLLYFDLLRDHKPSNFVIPLLSEQHSYTTHNVSLQQFYIPVHDDIRWRIKKLSFNLDRQPNNTTSFPFFLENRHMRTNYQTT